MDLKLWSWDFLLSVFYGIFCQYKDLKQMFLETVEPCNTDDGIM